MTKTRFELCLDEVLRHEGGYSDHPSDPGGATNMGITRKTLARWRKVSPWWNLPKSAVRDLGQAEAARIYRAGYWDLVKAGSMPPGMDLVVFDYAVNSGPDRAIRHLQTELGTKVDGLIGPLTLAALKARIEQGGASALIADYSTRRLNFLSQLANFTTFGKGWTTRVTAVRTAALVAAGASNIATSTNHWSKILDLINGYKTYIVAAIMLLAGLAQMLGLELPALDSQAAGHMVLEALAVIFLRKGLKGDVARA